jgi:hypothetical protein
MRSVRQEITLDILGVERSLIVHWGSSEQLLLVLHGSTEGQYNNGPLYPATRFESNYDSTYFEPHRSQRGYTQMYLSARLQNGWYCWQNSGAEFGTCSHADDGNDAAFVLSAISYAAALQNTSQNYIWGASGGGHMAWKLSCLFTWNGVGIVGGGWEIMRSLSIPYFIIIVMN